MYEMKEKRTRNFQASHFYANFYVDLIFERGLILERDLIFFNPRSKGPYFRDGPYIRDGPYFRENTVAKNEFKATFSVLKIIEFDQVAVTWN
jgi:hypothetical protein